MAAGLSGTAAVAVPLLRATLGNQWLDRAPASSKPNASREARTGGARPLRPPWFPLATARERAAIGTKVGDQRL